TAGGSRASQSATDRTSLSPRSSSGGMQSTRCLRGRRRRRRSDNRVLERFTHAERKRIGVHTCPGGDKDSTHSADVDYGQLLPSLFELKVGNFYIQLASEQDRGRVLGIIKQHAKPDQRIFVGVIDPINPR